MDYRIIHELSLDMPTAADVDELAHLCDTDPTTIVCWALWHFVGRHRLAVLTAREAQRILSRQEEAESVMIQSENCQTSE